MSSLPTSTPCTRFESSLPARFNNQLSKKAGQILQALRAQPRVKLGIRFHTRLHLLQRLQMRFESRQYFALSRAVIDALLALLGHPIDGCLIALL